MEEALRFELDVVRKEVTEWRTRCRKLREENEHLLKEMQTGEGDLMQIVTMLRQESERKDDQLSELRWAMKQQQEEQQKEHDQEVNRMKQDMREVSDKLAAQVTQMSIVQAELAVVKDFRKKRAQMQHDLDQTKLEMEQQSSRHRQQISEIEHKFYEEKVRFQKETAAKMAEMQRASHQEAIQRLDANTKQVLLENSRMADELRLQVQETDALQKTRRALEEETKRLRREVQLNEESVKEYAKAAHRQRSELNELQRQLKDTEDTLAATRAAAEAEREDFLKRHAKEVEEYRLETGGLRKLLGLKTRELKNIRQLARTVLRQRSDLETYFLDSLSMVRREMKKEAEMQRKSQILKPRATRRPDGKVELTDVAQLTWTERERVLRLLFNRINNGGVDVLSLGRTTTATTPSSRPSGQQHKASTGSLAALMKSPPPGRGSDTLSPNQLAPVHMTGALSRSSSSTVSIGAGGYGGRSNGSAADIDDTLSIVSAQSSVLCAGATSDAVLPRLS